MLALDIQHAKYKFLLNKIAGCKVNAHTSYSNFVAILFVLR